MKNKGLRTLSLILVFVMCLTLAPMGISVPSYGDSNTLSIRCTVKLPDGMVVPPNKLFQIQLSNRNNSLIGTIAAGKSQVTITGKMDPLREPFLQYTVLNDAGLNVISSGWYKSDNTVSHKQKEAYNFRADENPQTVLELPLDKGIALSGAITRPEKSKLSSPMTVKLTYTNGNDRSQFFTTLNFKSGQSRMAYRAVIAPANNYTTTYAISNYYAKDTVIQDTVATQKSYWYNQPDMNINLISGIEINGLVSIPDLLSSDHKGYGFKVFVESATTHKVYTDISPFYRRDSGNFQMTIPPKTRSMAYSLIVPVGTYTIRVQNTTPGDTTMAYAVDMDGTATKNQDQKGIYYFKVPTTVNLQGLFESSNANVSTPYLDDDLVLKGYMKIPENVSSDFSLELSVGTDSTNDSDNKVYSLYSDFEEPPAGNYPYVFIVPKAHIRKNNTYVKATLTCDNEPFSTLPGYAKSIYLNPKHNGSLVREASKLDSSLYGIEPCNFSLVKGSVATFSTKVAESSPLLEKETHYEYAVFDTSGNVVVANAAKITIPTNARKTFELAYVFIPTSLKTFKIGASSTNSDIYKHISYYSDKGATGVLTDAKTLTHGDLGKTLNLTIKPALFKQISGLIMLPEDFPTKHPAVQVNVQAENGFSMRYALEKVMILENERSAAFTITVPVEDFQSFKLTFNSNQAGVVQRQFYETYTSSRTSTTEAYASRISVGNPESLENIGVMKLIAGSPIPIEISNPNAMSDGWIELQAIESTSGNLVACYGMDTSQIALPVNTTLNLSVTGKPFILAIYQSNTQQTTYIKKTETSFMQVLKKSEATVFDAPVSAVNTPFILMPMIHSK